MAEGGDYAYRPMPGHQSSSALRASYQMNTHTSSAAIDSADSQTHLYDEYHTDSFQTQMSSYVAPSYVTPIFRNTYGQIYNGTYARPSPARVPEGMRFYTLSEWNAIRSSISRNTYGHMYNGTYARPSPARVPEGMRFYTLSEWNALRSSIFRNNDGQMYNGTHTTSSPQSGPVEIRSYTTPSDRTWELPDTSVGLYSQTTPETLALPEPHNNNLTSYQRWFLAIASHRINNTTALNDLTAIRETLDEISSGSNFVSPNNPPYLMSSPAPNTPQLSLSANNPPYLMSSTAPDTSQLSLNIPLATAQEPYIDFSNQSTMQVNDTNEHMTRAMYYTEGNSEAEAEIDRNLREVSMPEEEIIDHWKQLCPYNDTDVCDDDCPYLHGRLCGLCQTTIINPSNPDLHYDACLEQHEKQSQNKECNICMEKITELETDPYFGILENCNHCFCIRCLLTWRNNETMANHKACPVCRTPSEFVMTSKYWLRCPQSKKNVMDWMKENNEAIEYLD